jgi:hypothetical protein
MIRDAIYFVERPIEGSWRIGVVRVAGGDPEYGSERKGRTPALLTGADDVDYYDVDRREVRRFSADLQAEAALYPNVVCSPIHASSEIYCGSVEGLFQVSKENHRPLVLAHGRPGLITNIRSNSRLVVWTVDVGPEALAVDMLPAREPEGRAASTP